MKSWLPWLAVAGCARPPNGEPPRTHEIAARAPVVAARPEPASGPELPYAHSALPVAPHTIAAVVDGSIAALAVPADGGYAVTVDTSGTVLLWPTLDGKHEPVVVPARIAAQVATLRDGDAIAIAAVDKIGQLELIRVTAAGATIAHDDIAAPRPIVQLVATGAQLLALRDDQVLAAFDPKGMLAAELQAPPGERIAQLVSRGDRVVGVTAARGGKRSARALVVDGGLGWAAPSKRFECDDDGIALSPDGKQLVATVGKHQHVVEVDLARGTAVQLDYQVRDIADSEFVIGVTEHHRVFFMVSGTVYARAANGDTEPAGEGYMTGAVFSPARAIGGVGLGYLVVIEHGRARYLGYRAGSLADVVPAADGGWLATDGGELFRLDATLRFAKTVETPFPHHPGWEDTVALVDEDHVVVADETNYFLYRIGAKSGDLIASETYGRVEIVHATGLALLPDKTYPTLVRWNAKQGKFDPAFELPPGIYSGFVRLFDPAATHGIVAMFVDDNEPSDVSGKQKVRFHEVYTAGTKLRMRDRVELVDKSQLFSGHSGPMLDAVLPAAAMRANSADGTLIAELANDRITLFDRDGNVRWARTTNGARGLAWSAGDDLIAFGAGIAHVDLESGAYGDQRCGWDFGLWAKPPETRTAARMCVVP